MAYLHLKRAKTGTMKRRPHTPLTKSILLLGATCLCFLSPASSAESKAAANASPVKGTPVLAYQVAQVKTSVVSGRDGKAWLRVEARGMAPHGGYKNPRLVAAKRQASEAVLRLLFLIDPPDPNGVWPMVLTDVSAVALLPLQQQKRVRVRGFDNSGFAPINPAAPVFPPSWGQPPKFQTKDWRRLPGKYGFGSSTLASWIAKNLRDQASRSRN